MGYMGYAGYMGNMPPHPYAYDTDEQGFVPRPPYEMTQILTGGKWWYGIEYTPTRKCIEQVTTSRDKILRILKKVRAAEPDPDQLEAFIETCK